MVQTGKAAQTDNKDGVRETVTVTDNRTGREYELEITDGTVRARDLRQLKAYEGDFGLMVYDPGFANTASCRSAITHINGEQAILEYRGYPIEELAERSTFLEVAYLLVHGELPGAGQLEAWTEEVADAHVHPRKHEEDDGGVPARRPPDGNVRRFGGRDVDVLPRRQERERSPVSPRSDHPAHRQDADDCGVFVPA